MALIGGVIETCHSISTRSEEATPRWFSDRCEYPSQARVDEHTDTTIDVSVSCFQLVSLSQDRSGSTGIAITQSVRESRGPSGGMSIPAPQYGRGVVSTGVDPVSLYGRRRRR